MTDALDILRNEAEQRGWQPDIGRRARPGCWTAADERSEFTVTPPVDDFGVAVISAHTPDDSLRLHIGGCDSLDHGIRILRLFLGWEPAAETATSKEQP